MKKILYLFALSIPIFSIGQNSILKNWHSNKNIIYHDNYDLDHTLNYYDTDIVATYPTCKNKETNIDKTNCLITNLTIYTVDGLTKSNIIKNINVKKGAKKIRVVFIIDEKGKIYVKKIFPQYSNVFSQEVSRIIESTPTLIPAKLANKNIPVKFSLTIPFTIK